jgi:transposase
MSLHPEATYPIPEETQRVARAAFPRGNIYMQVADRLGTLYHDTQFAALFPTRGQPAEAPARLALATVLQFAEGLSDRQAADAVRSRIDWKYILGLELTDPGFHHTVLSEFRTRLVTGEAEALLLEALLTLARTQGLLKARGRQRTASTHVLAAIRVLNRLERVGETLRAALNSLAIVAPTWVQALAPPEWYDRYSHRVENYQMPKTDTARKALAAVIGADGQVLLQAIDAASAQPWLWEIPAVQILRRVWAEQYIEVNGTLSWREVKDMPPRRNSSLPPMIQRPGTVRSVRWSGSATRCISQRPVTPRPRI